MKYGWALAWLAATLIGLSGCGGGDAKDTNVLKIGYVLPAEHPTARAVEFFKARLASLSNGRIEVRTFPASQLGSATELVVACQNGNVEGAVVSAAPLSQYVEALNVVVMPFVFRDSAHQYAVLDGPVGEALAARIAEVQLVAAAWFDAGTRNVMTRKGPIKTPEDLRGLKIRVMDSNALREAIGRLGAAAIPMSQGEVYSALQTGVIDGWENNPPTCLTFSMYETGCTHFAWTRHVSIPDVLVFSRKWYDALDASLRSAVDRAAVETRDRQRTLWQAYEKKAVARLESEGMTFNEVDGEAFRARFAGFYDAFVEKHGASFKTLLDGIRNQKSP